jgi:hypothetical protein
MKRANKMLALLPSASFRPLQVCEWCRVREAFSTLNPEPQTRQPKTLNPKPYRCVCDGERQRERERGREREAAGWLEGGKERSEVGGWKAGGKKRGRQDGGREGESEGRARKRETARDIRFIHTQHTQHTIHTHTHTTPSLPPTSLPPSLPPFLPPSLPPSLPPYLPRNTLFPPPPPSLRLDIARTTRSRKSSISNFSPG